MTNKGSPFSSHPSVLAVLVLLLVVAVAMTANIVVASSSRAAPNGAKCNGSIAECHIEEEEELLLVVGDLENSLQRSLLGQSNSLPYSTLNKNRQAVDSARGQSYIQKVNPAGNRGCACYKSCRGLC
ncbi:hypothetical protein QJS10_CPB15g01396 [Acorus calamus]|uniref:Uncharacterized protein n=1 Tax=Acorus calamus TaxID=4465 RepID=A0AAV9D7Q8_ACOCL|nr:hypothetical protein QJS10_CPB15g01396 [Acorus calamus]